MLLPRIYNVIRFVNSVHLNSTRVYRCMDLRIADNCNFETFLLPEWVYFFFSHDETVETVNPLG